MYLRKDCPLAPAQLGCALHCLVWSAGFEQPQSVGREVKLSRQLGCWVFLLLYCWVVAPWPVPERIVFVECVAVSEVIMETGPNAAGSVCTQAQTYRTWLEASSMPSGPHSHLTPYRLGMSASQPCSLCNCNNWTLSICSDPGRILLKHTSSNNPA